MKLSKIRYNVAVTVLATVTLFVLFLIPLNGSSQVKPSVAKKAHKITRVIVDPVRRETLRQNIGIIGRFLARQTGPVAARTAGVIHELRVDVGDRVAKGDVIAVLKKERLVWQHKLQKAAVEHYAAQARTKKRQIKLFQQELLRLRSLQSSPAFSQARLDDKTQEVSVAESAISEANARLRMAEANLRLTAISLYDAEIKAPYAGIISKRPAEVGTYVAIGTPVVIIINEKSMEIEAEVPAIRVSSLTTNMVVAAEPERGPRFDTLVRAIIPDENPRTRTRAVRFTPKINSHFPKVAINQAVTLFIPTGPKKSVITVHKDAVIIKKSKRAVFVANDKRAELRFIRLGEANGSRFTVINGLQPKELVVIRGNERLRPGTKISLNDKVNNLAGQGNSRTLGNTGNK